MLRIIEETLKLGMFSNLGPLLCNTTYMRYALDRFGEDRPTNHLEYLDYSWSVQ